MSNYLKRSDYKNKDKNYIKSKVKNIKNYYFRNDLL